MDLKKSFSLPLLRWYQKHRRTLPWRSSRNPYHILVSEIMLQQTQVDTVIPYYRQFLKAFPSFQHLSRAPIERVLKLWEGLGYYARARNLHSLAQTVSRDHDGKLPDRGLGDLPGIGPYTEGAVRSIAFHQDYAVVDGNVQRVLARFFGLRQDPRSPAGRKKLWELAETLVPQGQAGDYNQAVMDLGAMICTPHLPRCSRCPVEKTCTARRLNWVHLIPTRKKSRRLPHDPIGAGVIWKGGKILIGQRPFQGLLGGLWEFPGGKQKRGETLPECIRREIQEELGVRVQVGRKLAKVKHAYSHFKITLHVYSCRYLSGTPRALGCRAWRWVAPGELKRFAFPAANQPIIRKLLIEKK